MKTRALIAATLALPFLLAGCNRADKSPTASGTTQEKQATTSPSSPGRMLEYSPPGAGKQPDAAPAPASPEASPGTTQQTPDNPAKKAQPGEAR